uniref:Mic1 domain-containing protein n=1 Tax=Gongylonema pulchrum TaxID=637853 RepID=A0A183DDC8_9BILA
LLKNGNGDSFSQHLSELFANGQIDLCLQLISQLSVECLDYEINEILLTHLKKQFIIMGYTTVCNYVEKWTECIFQSASGNRLIFFPS